MRAKEYLSQIGKFDERIREKKIELSIAETSGVRGIDYSGDKVQTSISDEMPKELIKVIEIIDDINAEVAKYTELRHLIINQIQGLSDKNSEYVLYERFVSGKKLSDIARRVPCAKSTVYRWYKKGMEDFELKYKGVLNCTSMI